MLDDMKRKTATSDGVTLAVRIDTSMAKALDAAAEQQLRTVSSLVRVILTEWLKKNKT